VCWQCMLLQLGRQMVLQLHAGYAFVDVIQTVMARCQAKFMHLAWTPGAPVLSTGRVWCPPAVSKQDCRTAVLPD
jgi:uncharacterized membrane protein (Fun14 family)